MFLLSLDEVLHYFGESIPHLEEREDGVDFNIIARSDGDYGYREITDMCNSLREALYTKKAQKYKDHFPACWWLRTTFYDDCAVFVSARGSICLNSRAVHSSDGVRPAMWVDLARIIHV